MLDLSKYAPALKQYYSDTRVENMVYKDHPFLAMVSKDEKFYGKNLPLPIIHGNPQGRSRTFTTAKANKTSSELKDFLLTRAKDYSLASIDNETAEASETDAGAFLKAMTVEIDGAMQSATNSLASGLFSGTSGTIGEISAIAVNSPVGFDTVTLADADNIVYFEVSQSIVTAEFESTGGLRGAGASTSIVSVDRDAGTFTVATGSLPAGTVITDFIFVEGDRGLSEAGLASWLPTTAPGAGDSFFGVDRSIDPTRLAGVRVDGTALPIEEALIKGANRINREGGRPDACFVNYAQFENLEKALGSKVQYMVSTAFGRADIGFEGIQIKSNKGTVNVIADPFCPSDRAYMLTMNSWKLYSLKKSIRILDLDGNKMLRESDADAVELRVGGYRQLGCNAPGWNGVISLS